MLKLENMYWKIFAFASCIKFLLVSSYFSTDFEVHRNWMAIVSSLSVKDWYQSNVSEWTLDYPPFFAWFEYILAFFAKVWDENMLGINNLNYFTPTVLIFMRVTVIVSDIFMAYTLKKLIKCLTIYKPKNVMCVPCDVSLPFLVLCNFGLLIIDHVHFQYNGFLFGFLFLSISNILEGNFYRGALWFTVLVNFKHIYLYAAPAYAIFYLYWLFQTPPHNNINNCRNGITNIEKNGKNTTEIFSDWPKIALRYGGLEDLYSKKRFSNLIPTHTGVNIHEDSRFNKSASNNRCGHNDNAEIGGQTNLGIANGVTYPQNEMWKESNPYLIHRTNLPSQNKNDEIPTQNPSPSVLNGGSPNFIFQANNKPLKASYNYIVWRCISLALIVVSVFAVSFGPFIYLGQIKAVLNRLFPFGRGLRHHYWAPNVWAIYGFADKTFSLVKSKPIVWDTLSLLPYTIISTTNTSITNTIQNVSSDNLMNVTFENANVTLSSNPTADQSLKSHKINTHLPEITPKTSFLLTMFIFFLPFIMTLLQNVRKPQKIWIKREDILLFITWACLTSFLFGWHVHEKACLMYLLPALIYATPLLGLILPCTNYNNNNLTIHANTNFNSAYSGKRISASAVTHGKTISDAWRKDYLNCLWLLMFSSHYSIFPLLFTWPEWPTKTLLFLLYHCMAYSLIFHAETNTPEQKSRFHALKHCTFSKMFSIYGFILYLMTTIVYPLLTTLFIFKNETHYQYYQTLAVKYEFLPLMLISIYGAVGICIATCKFYRLLRAKISSDDIDLFSLSLWDDLNSQHQSEGNIENEVEILKMQ